MRQVGRYKLEEVIGRGGLGVVYQARDEADQQVAVKLLNHPAADSLAARRMVREFTELAHLRHRNIVRVLDVGVHEDTPFLAMEFVDGVPLRRYLDAGGDLPSMPPPTREDPSTDDDDEPITSGGNAWMRGQEEADSLDPKPRHRPGKPMDRLPPDIRLALNRPERIRRLRDAMSQVCDGLAYVHARGLVHRDVKPSNVLVTEGGLAKLVDFGLVKSTFANSQTTAAGRIVGTYRYMSPEQARGRPVDGRADLYAIGAILYEMLCRHPPFAHTQAVDLVRAIVLEAPVPIRQVNPEADATLADIAERLLHKNPGARYASATEVARRLRSSRDRAV